MNVFESAQERIAYCFREFDYVYVSFSGGKDSGVLLELTAMEAAKQGKRFGIYHMDYEAQYNLTTDYVQQTLDRYQDRADIYHICVPFKVTTCTSMFQSYWRPWQADLQDLWVRPMPERAMTADCFPFYRPNQWDYDFQREFGEWLCQTKGRVCCLVGIRAEESLNRWRTAFAESENRRHYDGKQWTTLQGKCVNAYPIIDWLLQDVWIANSRNGWQYNRLYDLMYLAGVPVHKMRVASPFLSEGQETLRLYQVIEPDTWGRLVGRVNGVNFAGLYGGTTAMGWKNITKPPRCGSGRSAEGACRMRSLPNCKRQAYRWRCWTTPTTRPTNAPCGWIISTTSTSKPLRRYPPTNACASASSRTTTYASIWDSRSPKTK